MSMTDAQTTAGSTGIQDEYDPTKGISLDMGFPIRTARFVASISLVTIYASSISSSPKPTTLTMKLCRDSAGDECLVTSTAAQMEIGTTTGTKATVIYRVDGIISMKTGDVLYVFAKTNKGTLNVDEVRITWATDD